MITPVEGLSENFSHVWYASYGSNLNQERFLTYIRGGQPEGSSREYQGCTDTSFPLGDDAMELPLSLYFARKSKTWDGGGVGFVAHEQIEDPSKSRAYLITSKQFEEVVGQENGQNEGIAIDYDAVQREGKLALPEPYGSRFYGMLLLCGEVDGFPVLTFTNANSTQNPTKPTVPYLKMLSSGLAEAHGMDVEEAVDYLVTKPGVAGQYEAAELIEALR